jgi:hypothetical protein
VGVVIGEQPGGDCRPERAAPQDEDIKGSGVRIQRLILAVEDLLPGVGGVAAEHVEGEGGPFRQQRHRRILPNNSRR